MYSETDKWYPDIREDRAQGRLHFTFRSYLLRIENRNHTHSAVLNFVRQDKLNLDTADSCNVMVLATFTIVVDL